MPSGRSVTTPSARLTLVKAAAPLGWGEVEAESPGRPLLSRGGGTPSSYEHSQAADLAVYLVTITTGALEAADEQYPWFVATDGGSTPRHLKRRRLLGVPPPPQPAEPLHSGDVALLQLQYVRASEELARRPLLPGAAGAVLLGVRGPAAAAYLWPVLLAHVALSPRCAAGRALARSFVSRDGGKPVTTAVVVVLLGAVMWSLQPVLGYEALLTWAVFPVFAAAVALCEHYHTTGQAFSRPAARSEAAPQEEPGRQLFRGFDEGQLVVMQGTRTPTSVGTDATVCIQLRGEDGDGKYPQSPPQLDFQGHT